MAEKTIDVLGTPYRLIVCSEMENKRLDGCDGFCDETAKKCVVQNYETSKDDLQCKENLQMQSNKVVRHELIHAFLFESGLAENCEWAKNEEMVDWVAKQFPKLQKAFEAAGAL